MRKFFGFTLAEVLIVVAIIGVVAVLTLPVLTNKIGDKILETQHKKAQALMANGIKLLTAQNTTPYLKDTALKRCRDNAECIAAEIKKVFKVAEDNLSANGIYDVDYEFEDEDYQVWNDANFDYVFTTADGITFGIYRNADDRESLTVFVDANGKKNPNIGGEDFCSYDFDETGMLTGMYCDTRFKITGTKEEQACMLMMNEYGCEHIWQNGECKYICNANEKDTLEEETDEEEAEASEEIIYDKKKIQQ